MPNFNYDNETIIYFYYSNTLSFIVIMLISKILSYLLINVNSDILHI